MKIVHKYKSERVLKKAVAVCWKVHRDYGSKTLFLKLSGQNGKQPPTSSQY
jgi:hypothetical protein